MKQHITPEQLRELSEKGRLKLEEFILKIDPDVIMRQEIGGKLLLHYYPLSIGQMIEFLIERAMGDLDLSLLINSSGASVWIGLSKDKKLGGGEDKELIDALYEAVKEGLEK